MKLGRYNVRGKALIMSLLLMKLGLPRIINNRDMIKVFPSHYTYPASLTSDLVKVFPSHYTYPASLTTGT
jgi:hypothetical protein